MEKRGISHIEVILAFLLFFGAIVTVFYFFNPERPPESGSFRLENLYDSISDNVSTEAIIMDLKINNTDNQIIRDSNGFVLIDGGNIPLNYNISTYNINKDAVRSGIGQDGYGNRVMCINASEAENKMSFSIISSEITNPKSTTGECKIMLGTGYMQINKTYYILSFSDKKKMVSEKKILELNISYMLNYPAVKAYLGLKNTDDFDYSFEFSNGDKIEQKKKIPMRTEVKSINKKIEILRKNGTIDDAKVNIRLWEI